MRQVQKFLVDYPVDGAFEVHVNKVSNYGQLQITLDGKLMLDQELPTGPGDGPWKESIFFEKWNIYQSTYDRGFRIPVSAGKHTITVDNKGKDWLSLTGYRLINYQTKESIKLRAFGLQNDREALLWIQNMQHTWYRLFEKMPLEPIPPTFIEINGLQDGRYKVEWWDTYQADKVEYADATCANGMLKLEAPQVKRDIACKIRFQKS